MDEIKNLVLFGVTMSLKCVLYAYLSYSFFYTVTRISLNCMSSVEDCSGAFHTIIFLECYMQRAQQRSVTAITLFSDW